MYNINVSAFYPANYKYDMSRFMRYDIVNDMYDILDSEFIKAIPKIQVYGIRTITVEEGSPSLLCERLYGYFNYQYWWIIMEMNGLISPDDLVAGLQIKYPLLSTLDTLFGSMNPRFND